jgi:hypothetical protein
LNRVIAVRAENQPRHPLLAYEGGDIDRPASPVKNVKELVGFRDLVHDLASRSPAVSSFAKAANKKDLTIASLQRQNLSTVYETRVRVPYTDYT